MLKQQRVDHLEPTTQDFYVRGIQTLTEAKAPFLVGGAYAFARYTGIERHTKDFDIFVAREDCARVLKLLAGTGCRTELTFPHWLGKAFQGDDFIDVIFSSGSGIAEVDGAWFEHAADGEVFGLPVKLIPAEEMIWSKSFVMERERYDGADIAHLLLARAEQMDWRRLIDRFALHWRVLFGNLVLFGFIYPAARHKIPGWVLQELVQRLQEEMQTAPPDGLVCNGTLISREQYLIDVDRWGYEDARLPPRGKMTDEQIAHWTAAIDRK